MLRCSGAFDSALENRESNKRVTQDDCRGRSRMKGLIMPVISMAKSADHVGMRENLCSRRNRIFRPDETRWNHGSEGNQAPASENAGGYGASCDASSVIPGHARCWAKKSPPESVASVHAQAMEWPVRRSREGGSPATSPAPGRWIPAFANCGSGKAST